MADTCYLDLKSSKCSKASLLKNDFISHNDSIFRCLDKCALYFQDLDTGMVTNIDRPIYWRLEVLNLVPIRCERSGDQVTLTGKEFGSGPECSFKVVGSEGIWEFCDVINENTPERRRSYSVYLAPTSEETHYLLNIQEE